MSFRMQIDPRSRKAARFITGVHKQLQQAYVRASSRGLTQQNIADELGVDRSTINRRLLGGGNLTLRSLSDFAHAMDEDVEVIFKPSFSQTPGGNIRMRDNVVVTAAPTRTVGSIVTPVASAHKKSDLVGEYV